MQTPLNVLHIYLSVPCLGEGQQRGNTQANHTSEPLYVEAHSFMLYYFINVLSVYIHIWKKKNIPGFYYVGLHIH